MTITRTSTGSLPPKAALPYLQRTPSMANPTFEVGREPLVLATAEAYPENKYSQQEFLEALLQVIVTRRSSSIYQHTAPPVIHQSCHAAAAAVHSSVDVCNV